VKVLPKKRINQLKLRLFWNMLDTSVVKQQLFWYSASIAVYAWFMFWIAYDIFVWHKPLFQGNITNYIGAAASIAFIWVEARLLKSKRLKKKLAPPEEPKPQKPQEKQTEQPKTHQNQTQPATTLPPKQTHTNKNTCIHRKVYLQNHQNPTQMPDECLTCTKLIQCITNKK
jgi:hypothetical protein